MIQLIYRKRHPFNIVFYEEGINFHKKAYLEMSTHEINTKSFSRHETHFTAEVLCQCFPEWPIHSLMGWVKANQDHVLTQVSSCDLDLVAPWELIVQLQVYNE